VSQVEDQDAEYEEEDREEEDSQVASITSAIQGFYGINAITETDSSEEEEETNVLLERADWLEDIGEYPTENPLVLHLEETENEQHQASNFSLPNVYSLRVNHLLHGNFPKPSNPVDRNTLLNRIRHFIVFGEWPVKLDPKDQGPGHRHEYNNWNDEIGPHPWITEWEKRYEKEDYYDPIGETLEDIKSLFGENTSGEHIYEERQHTDWELNYLNTYDFVETRRRYYRAPKPDSTPHGLTWFYQHKHLLTSWQRAVLRRINHFNGNRYNQNQPKRVSKSKQHYGQQRMHDYLAVVLLQGTRCPDRPEYDLYRLYANVNDGNPLYLNGNQAPEQLEIKATQLGNATNQSKQEN
jgi:hypothetical protein